MSVKKDLHGKNVRLSPKTSNIMTPASVNSIVSALTNNTNNNDESDSDVLKIDEDGDVINKDKEGTDKDGSDDDIAAVNENGMDDSEEEIAMGNNEIAERTGENKTPAILFKTILLKLYIVSRKCLRRFYQSLDGGGNSILDINVGSR